MACIGSRCWKPINPSTAALALGSSRIVDMHLQRPATAEARYYKRLIEYWSGESSGMNSAKRTVMALCTLLDRW